jgi:hypothetical protein
VGTPGVISYRKVLQANVPEEQRKSTRALVQAHGLAFPASLLALIRILETAPPPPHPPPVVTPPPPAPPIIAVSMEFSSGGLENRVLRVTGSGFTPGESVELLITTTAGSDDPFTGNEETTADTSGFIDFSRGVFCRADGETTFAVQAIGLTSSKRSQVGGASC